MIYQELWRRLATIYDEGEARAIARMVYEVRYGLSLSDLLLGKDTQLSANDQKELEEITRRLLGHEPVQYVLGAADFCGRTFHVAPGVLIPRPETEELCRSVIKEVADRRLAEDGRACSILDIGTGSGCIAVTLAAEITPSMVTAWDVSERALGIARKNALRHHVVVDFGRVDILVPHSALHVPHQRWNLIVSNPPYILNKERVTMEANVLDHEPAQALFVPDDDPLLFYRAIARYAIQTLTPDGMLALEINRAYGQETCQLLESTGFSNVSLHQDSYHNDRFIIAEK